MARKSKGWLIVNVGPAGMRGKLSRTVREKEPAGNCDHCGTHRRVLFSYDDDGFHFCGKSCWTTATLLRKGVRQPSRSQVTEQNQRKLRTVVRRKPALAVVMPLAGRVA